jgi:hypothetical protein
MGNLLLMTTAKPRLNVELQLLYIVFNSRGKQRPQRKVDVAAAAAAVAPAPVAVAQPVPRNGRAGARTTTTMKRCPRKTTTFHAAANVARPSPPFRAWNNRATTTTTALTSRRGRSPLRLRDAVDAGVDPPARRRHHAGPGCPIVRRRNQMRRRRMMGKMTERKLRLLEGRRGESLPASMEKNATGNFLSS